MSGPTVMVLRAEWDRIREEHAEMVAALQRIAEGKLEPGLTANLFAARALARIRGEA